MSYGFLIPVYNHGAPAYKVVKELLPYGLPVILVDDASDSESKRWLKDCADLSGLVRLITLEKNRGKGKALTAGFREAAGMGLSHVLQLDADGQHDVSRIPRFIELSKAKPGFLIAGCPEYDESAPANRVKGRRVANFFTHLVTLNRKAIKDSMCGFRVYPVEQAFRLSSRGLWDHRMGFDIEILVKMYWKMVPVISETVKVVYPEGGMSNFRMVRDNIRITLVFIRLCLGMVFHIPSLIKMRKLYQ